VVVVCYIYLTLYIYNIGRRKRNKDKIDPDSLCRYQPAGSDAAAFQGERVRGDSAYTRLPAAGASGTLVTRQIPADARY